MRVGRIQANPEIKREKLWFEFSHKLDYLKYIYLYMLLKKEKDEY